MPASKHSETVPSDKNHTAECSKEKHAVITKLAKTIEGEIIPRLLLAHKGNAPSPSRHIPFGFAIEEVQRFAGLSFATDPTRCYAFLDRMRADNVPLETIILDLFAPAAAYLGELWKADLCSFTEVTIGLTRLRQMLRELTPAFESESPGWRHGRRALLLPVPGEQHSFGILVVETFFRREGWDVWSGPVENSEDIARLVESQWFAVVGFSLSAERFLDRLTALIRSVRRVSCNREIGILVGGPVFLEKPHLVSEVGADSGAKNGPNAVLEARNLLAQAAVAYDRRV